MDAITVARATCKACGLCAEVCPNKILRKLEQQPPAPRPERVGLCFKCGQCMAVCPTCSIQVESLSYERDFIPLPDNQADARGFFNLLATRRAVRNFLPKPVERGLLEQVVKAIAFAPPGFPPIKFDLVVVQNPETVKQALPYMVELFEFLVNAMRHPLMKLFIKKEVGKRRFRTMQGHLLPMLIQRLPTLRDRTEDTITRNAPAMILFLADREGEDVREDVCIAATFGMLAAHALGLGGSIMDIIPPAIEKKKELRRMFRVPDHQEVVASLILGYPKYKYQRGIVRTIRKVEWV